MLSHFSNSFLSPWHWPIFTENSFKYKRFKHFNQNAKAVILYLTSKKYATHKIFLQIPPKFYPKII